MGNKYWHKFKKYLEFLGEINILWEERIEVVLKNMYLSLEQLVIILIKFWWLPEKTGPDISPKNCIPVSNFDWRNVNAVYEISNTIFFLSKMSSLILQFLLLFYLAQEASHNLAFPLSLVSFPQISCVSSPLYNQQSGHTEVLTISQVTDDF